MAKSKGEDPRESGFRSAARKTLSQAHFFLAQANRSGHDFETYECYVEAGVLFARTVLSRLRKEYGRKPGFDMWIKLRESHPLIKDLINSRDAFIHEQKILTPSSEDILYSDKHEKLKEQLDEIEAIVDGCERQFK